MARPEVARGMTILRSADNRTDDTINLKTYAAGSEPAPVADSGPTTYAYDRTATALSGKVGINVETGTEAATRIDNAIFVKDSAGVFKQVLGGVQFLVDQERAANS